MRERLLGGPSLPGSARSPSVPLYDPGLWNFQKHVGNIVCESKAQGGMRIRTPLLIKGIIICSSNLYGGLLEC